MVGRTQMAVGGVLLVLVLAVSACSGSGGSSDDFENAVRDARDQAQLRIDEATDAIESESEGLAAETVLMGPLAENLPAISEALSEYADAVEEQDTPEQYTEEVERHVPALRELEALVEQQLEAARAGDDSRATAVQEKQRALLAELAAGVSAEYAEFAFVEPFETSFVSLFGGLTDEELKYLDQVRDAQNEFSRRNADFGRALGRQYSSPEALLRALYDAGAGQAFAAVQDRALALESPERFEADHERWLEQLEEQVRLDRIIGEAARDGDVVGFLANNIRLGLAEFPDAAEVDPAFAAAISGPDSGLSALQAVLDSDTAVAQTEYGPDLFVTLKRLAVVDPASNIFGLFQLPASDEARLAAISETKDELLAVAEDRRSSIAALDPPDDYATDHGSIAGYFDDFAAYLESVVSDAENGDPDAITAATDELDETYCDATTSLSEDIAPATDVFFDPDFPACNG